MISVWNCGRSTSVEGTEMCIWVLQDVWWLILYEINSFYLLRWVHDVYKIFEETFNLFFKKKNRIISWVFWRNFIYFPNQHLDPIHHSDGGRDDGIYF